MSKLGLKLVMSGVLVLPACGPATEDTEGDTSGTGGASNSASNSATEGDTEGDTDPTGEPDPTGGYPSTVAIGVNKDVDILFVIDNSGSMAEEQALLAKNFGAFIDALEAPEVAANYRIGITTTDAGNPRCPSSAPENGTLVLSSCLDRVEADEFSYGGEDFSFACSDFCAKKDADLQVQSTITQLDDTPTPRKWIERRDGQSNIGGVASNVEAFRCYGPQGVVGCGFESPLESMYKALAKSSDPASVTNYGFLRDAAILSIVVLTDEVDCSYNQAHKDIFVSNKVFWNSPDDPQPTSALCWRAGVECSGDGSPFSECHAANWGANGDGDVSDADAVLKPVSEYISFVKAIEEQKRDIEEGQRVLVSLIAGVPAGYDQGASELVYENSPDQELQDSYGVGPGCVFAGGDPNFPAIAVPPVRAREFAEAFIDAGGPLRNLYSICQPDYSEALASIAAQIRGQIRPACMPNCVADSDPQTEIVEPSCTLVEHDLSDNSTTAIPECDEIDGVRTVPAGATVCVAMLTDQGNGTPSKNDDMSAVCVDYGFNLEFVLVRSAPAPQNVSIEASCELSSNKKADCPNL